MVRSLARYGLALTVVFSAQSARAEPPRVVVVVPGARDPLTAHLVDELIAIGATVELVVDGAGDLATLARSHGARAAVRIEGRSAALWLDNGAGALRRIEPSEPGPEGVALRTAELVRANVLAMEVHAPAPTRTAPSPPLEPSARVESDRRPPAVAEAPKATVTAFAGPAMVAHPGGGMTVGAAMTGAVGARLTEHFGAELLLAFPLVPSVISAPDGEVSVAGSLVTVGAWVDALPRTSRLALSMGAGGGIGFLDYDAEATSSRVRGQDGMVAFGLPYAHIAMAWRALPPLALRVDAVVGLALPRPVILVAGLPGEARFGQPIAFVAAGPQLELP